MNFIMGWVMSERVQKQTKADHNIADFDGQLTTVVETKI